MKEKDIPELVLRVWAFSVGGSPVPSSLFEEAITKHPEHFPKEVAEREKWGKIPQEVHDAYYNEHYEERKEKLPKFPHPKGGIFHMIECRECQNALNARMDVEAGITKRLRKKYYKKYGVKN